MWPYVLASALGLAATGNPAPADAVAVTVRMTATDAVEVDYDLPATCARLPFLKDGPGAATIRARWQSQDACGTANGESMQRVAANCARLRFRVPVTSDKVTGYPGSFPAGRAIYAHMSNYAVGAQCGAVSYRFVAPGGVETSGARFDREAPSDADSPALLFLSNTLTGSGDLDYFDPGLSAAAVSQIRAVANDTASFLHAEMPRAPFRRPIIAAALANEPGGPNIGGSAGDILLLTLFNWPAAPAPEYQRRMNKLVAHEMSHRFQMRDAVDVYPDARLMHEGGAEFLRWSVSLRRGWLTPQEAADELDDALAACMLGTRERSWREVSPEDIAANRLEYSCGLPAYVYALAARKGGGTPYARLDDFYRQLRAGARPDFAQSMECGPVDCTPLVLPALLNEPGPMIAQWKRVLDETGLAKRRPATQSQTDAMMLQALTQLVRQDCAGKRSMTPTPASVLIDALPTCGRLTSDVEVVRVERHPVFGNPRALPATVDACAKRHSVVLGLKNGSSLYLACEDPYHVTPFFFAADMEKVTRGLMEER